MYVEIAGIMGTGKTSLAATFQRHAGYTPLTETDNEIARMFFVKEYLSNPSKYGFEGNLNFLAFHLNRLQENLCTLPANSNVVTDVSIIQQHAYAKPIVTADELETIHRIIRHSYSKLPTIDLRIVPALDIDTHFERVNQRGRDVESAVPKAWLEHTQSLMQEAIELLGNDTPTLYVDAKALNWVESTADQLAVIKLAEQKLGYNLY